MKHLILFFALNIIATLTLAQVPQKFSYQSVIRNSGNQVLANQTVGVKISILEGGASGTVVYAETHNPTTTVNGLANLEIGGGNALSGNFATIDWSSGLFFVKTETDLNGGNTYTITSTQQLLSVPYAFRAEDISYRVSQTGDTLFIGNGGFVIVPGISAANLSGGGNGGDGGGGSAGTSTGTTAHTCGTPNVVNAGLTYNSVIDQEGNIYKTIVIANREWMAENLKTTTYRNGDPIVSGLSATQWSGTTSGAWAHYNGDASLDCPYGKLYNFYACSDARQLCPTGWHVPTEVEWSTLINQFDPAAQGGINWSNFAGGPLKSTGTSQAGTGLWNAPNTGATNTSGFSALPGGFITALGVSNNSVLNAYFWTSTEVNSTTGYGRTFYHDPGSVIQTANFGKRSGMSVRCIRD
jgi:uncharacterized protein (TIGR02145 family)